MTKKIKYGLGILLLSVIVMMAGFMVYVNDYYQSGEIAQEILASGSLVTYQNSDVYLPAPTSIALQPESLIVFYPGGKVESIAYLPLAKMLQEKGVGVIVCKMPFNLAVFDPSRAQSYLDEFDAKTRIYLMGHSLGGAMASSFASDHQENIAGLILLGSYLYGDYPADLQLTVYGSNDLILDRAKIDYQENVIIIEGGNHSGFGDYGHQKGDGLALISPTKQQQLTVASIMGFLEQQNNKANNS